MNTAKIIPGKDTPTLAYFTYAYSTEYMAMKADYVQRPNGDEWVSLIRLATLGHNLSGRLAMFQLEPFIDSYTAEYKKLALSSIRTVLRMIDEIEAEEDETENDQES